MATTKQEIFEEVKKLIADSMRVDVNEIKEDSKFIDDLGADSLDIVELVMAMESKFNIEIPDEDTQKIRTVKDAVEYLYNKLNTN